MNPNFFIVWIGQALSQAGIRMYQIAFAWWLLTLGGKGTGKELGLFMVAGALPSILLVKSIGRAIDKTKTKNILILSSAFTVFLMAAIAFCLKQSLLGTYGIYLAAFLAASLQAFLDPAFSKAAGELVPKKEMGGAVAWQSSTQSLANFGGAAAGAFLIERLGIVGITALTGLCYLICGLCSFIAQFRYVRPLKEISSEDEKRSAWELLDATPLIKNILITFGLVNFFVTPTLVILPLYTLKTLEGNAATLGFLEAALWIGLLCGTASSKFIEMKSTIKLGFYCLTTIGACFFISGFLIHKWIYLSMLFSIGFALGVNNVKFINLFQSSVAPEAKGRFFALMQALISFTFPISYFLFGMLADSLAPAKLCLIQGCGVALVGLFFLNLTKQETKLKPYNYTLETAP